MGWMNDIVRSEERNADQRQGLQRPFGMYVSTISVEAEQMKVSYYGNKDRLVPIPHPFISTGSWIRAIPESGAAYAAIFRADEPEPQALSTFQRETKARFDSYRTGTGLYRILYPGESEISSIGWAQSYHTRRATHELRGGIIQRFTEQDRLWINDLAPTHVQGLLQHNSALIQDQYRLGVVNRPSNTWEVSWPKVRGNFAAEEYLDLRNPAGSAPTTLVRYQRGHVLDSKGSPVKHSSTQIPLRLYEAYYANDDTFTSHEIDEKGNLTTSLSAGATEGYELKIPGGAFRATAGKDFIIIGGQGFQVSIKKEMNLTVGTNYKLAVTGNSTITTNGNCNINTTGSTNIKSTGACTVEGSKITLKSSSNSLNGGVVTDNAANRDPITGIPLSGVGGVSTSG